MHKVGVATINFWPNSKFSRSDSNNFQRFQAWFLSHNWFEMSWNTGFCQCQNIRNID